jgi:hypothetical protein
MQDYNKQFSALLASGEDDARDLQGLNSLAGAAKWFAAQIWQTMLTKGFDADFGEPIHLERAREIQVTTVIMVSYVRRSHANHDRRLCFLAAGEDIGPRLVPCVSRSGGCVHEGRSNCQ